MPTSDMSVQQLSINTIRTLAMDAVQAANSGHPGTPMALAPVMYDLFTRRLNYDPDHPNWPARDRFILSCGHASMLLYATLHLARVKKADGAAELAITLDDIKNFRQLHSPCAGHPEHGEAQGIETTTGPLGQGIGNSVGMAIAGKWLAARYDRPGYDLFGYNVYALCSDGDLMEGVGCEAASLAGHLKLGNLCWIYDDNNITIEGHTDLAFSEDVGRRFEGLGWRVLKLDDANEVAEFADHLAQSADATRDRPTLIIVKSVIAWGSPNKANTHGAHGAPLGEDEVRATKQAYGWPADERFLAPPEVFQHFEENLGRRGAAAFDHWTQQFAKYQEAFPQQAAELKMIYRGELPSDWDADIPTFPADAKGVASRNSGGKVLNAIASKIPWMMGGSADLAPSTKTLLTFDDTGSFSSENPRGRNLHFGIREHAMGAVVNGMALCGLQTYGSTFFVFSDYMRPSMRLAAIMRLRSLFIFTHDSIGVGEDGPTHQPIEHLAACRAIPNMMVMRPGDANEVSACYRAAIRRRGGPVTMVLTRQDLPTLDRAKYADAAGAEQGGYILADNANGAPDVILMATGSELSLAVEAYERLDVEGVKARVVSMPCFELFEAQDKEYRERVLPPSCEARVAVEAGIRQSWDRYLGAGGVFIGMNSFGASAPAEELMKHFGLTADNVVAAAQRLLSDFQS